MVLRSLVLRRLGLAVLVFSAIAVSVALRAGDPPTKIRIIHTNDTLGYLEPCG
jgi:2',3'-cyclic-nucleotide 2'-phosphodiesterase (5'-nucleotidase family)